MECVTIVSYRAKVNRELSNCIYLRTCLRQGDPFSPYLFIIGADVLSRLILKAQSEGTITSIKMVPTAPVISHIIFAYDAMLFTKADISDSRDLYHILATYSTIFGQKINNDKYGIIFSHNFPYDVKEAI